MRSVSRLIRLDQRRLSLERMLIVEELHLLLTNPAGKPEQFGTMRAYGEVAALLTDLLVADRVSLTGEKRPRVHVVSDAPTGHPVLDAALPLIRKRDGARLENLVTWGKLDPEDDVVASLVRAGVLVFGDRAMLGLGKARAVEADPAPERQVRARLAAVLRGGSAPTVADATLLATLQGLGVARRILKAESGGMRASELKRRIADLVAGSAVGSAVDRAVQSINAALMTTAFVALTASTSGS